MTPDLAHDDICGPDCTITCATLEVLNLLAAAERAAGREEAAEQHTRTVQSEMHGMRLMAFRECGLTHSALESRAERRGWRMAKDWIVRPGTGRIYLTPTSLHAQMPDVPPPPVEQDRP